MATIPPSPAAMVFTPWNEKVLASERRHPPTAPPGVTVPRAWQASSTIFSPAARATGARASMSQARPARCTGRTAFARGLARSTASASVCAVIRPLTGSTSAKTTSAPQYRAAVAVDRKVMAGTMQTSPGPIPSPARAKCRAEVPLEQAAASVAPTRAARSASKAAIRGP